MLDLHNNSGTLMFLEIDGIALSIDSPLIANTNISAEMVVLMYSVDQRPDTPTNADSLYVLVYNITSCRKPLLHLT